MNLSASVQIIIPYYKEFDYFIEALDSVMAQDNFDFCVLIIDDGSHDERLTAHIESLNDTRITYVQNAVNIGLARNFELARNLADKDFVVFLGQDDILESNYLSTVLPWINSQASVVITQPRVKVINESGRDFLPLSDRVKLFLNRISWVLGEKVELNGKFASLLPGKLATFTLLIGDYLYFPTLIWKKSAMGSFDVTRDVTLDYKMILEVLAKGGDLLLLPDQIARYRRHQRSASMRPDKMIERLFEEKYFHSELKSVEFIRESFLLRTINTVRFTQRLHALQVSSASLLRCDWQNALLALKCVF